MIISLARCDLDIGVERSDWPLDDLCAFASRHNPRRAFLVVSKILGRHIPVKPSVMRASFRDLAAKIDPDLPGPVLIFGMAETAICLGQGVHEEYCRLTGRKDAMYLHSTRQQLDAPILCSFEEPHSHASRHLVYRPHEMPAFRSLIIVDDEISTGTTIKNLVKAVLPECPSIERVEAVTLTDWSHNDASGSATAMPTHSLLDGRLSCVIKDDGIASSGADGGFDKAAEALGRMEIHHNYGRLGRWDVAQEGDVLADKLTLETGMRLRVIGTGEFGYAPFRIAERLEDMGYDVVVQSTTRSPIQANEAIAAALEFDDNYGTAVRNFIYNIPQNDGVHTIICHETPVGSIDPAFVRGLHATVLAMGGDAL